MTTTNPLFLFLLFGVIGIISITSILITDHIVNYETWDDNKRYFLKDFHGYEVTCDVNYFAEPTNCQIVDEQGNKVPNDTIELLETECLAFEIETGNLVPCILS